MLLVLTKVASIYLSYFSEKLCEERWMLRTLIIPSTQQHTGVVENKELNIVNVRWIMAQNVSQLGIALVCCLYP